MPAYDIRYLDGQGALAHKFSAVCDNDKRAQVLAHLPADTALATTMSQVGQQVSGFLIDDDARVAAERAAALAADRSAASARALYLSGGQAGLLSSLLESGDVSELSARVEAVQQVHAGGAPMSLGIARKVINHFHQPKKSASELDRLTARELDILKLLAKGYMYKEIADQLGISMSTVRTHITAVYEKLHVQSRTEAAMKLVGQV